MLVYSNLLVFSFKMKNAGYNSDHPYHAIPPIFPHSRRNLSSMTTPIRRYPSVRSLIVAATLGIVPGVCVPEAHAQVILDDFNRADSTNLGPNWIEQSGNWSLAGNTLQSQ